MGRQQIPDSPKLTHFLWPANRNTNVLRHLGNEWTQRNIVFLKVVDDLFRRQSGIQHHKICMRIDPAEHAGIGLIEQFLDAELAETLSLIVTLTLTAIRFQS